MDDKKRTGDIIRQQSTFVDPKPSMSFKDNIDVNHNNLGEIDKFTDYEDVNPWVLINEGINKARLLFEVYQKEVAVVLLSLISLILVFVVVKKIICWRRNRQLEKEYELLKEVEASPEEQFAEKLLHEEYEEALSVAHRFNLDTDPIFQQQWSRCQDITVEAISGFLKNVKNRIWVLDECLDKIPDKLEATKSLLEYGLELTSYENVLLLNSKPILVENNSPKNKARSVIQEATSEDKYLPSNPSLLTSSDVEKLTEQQKSYICFRVQLLKYRSRLLTYEAILGGPSVSHLHYSRQVYSRFREDSIMKSVISFAHKGDCDAVSVLFTLHGKETLDHWLMILSNFPEVMSPVVYQNLLPECDDTQVGCWQQQSICDDNQDWSEKLVDREDDSSLYASLLYEQTHLRELLQFRGTESMTKSSLHDWFILRAKQIEQLSSLPENSLQLLKLGMERNVPGLTQTHSDLETFSTLVYECLPRSEEHVDISFDQFLLMTPSHVIDLMMIGVEKMDGKTFVNCIRAFVIPFLRKVEIAPSSSKPGSPIGSPIQGKHSLSIFLEQFLIKTAKTNINLVKYIFEASVDQKEEDSHWSSGHEPCFPEQEPIVQRVEDLLKLALNVIYANEDVNQYLDDAFEIVGFLPQRVPDSSPEVDALQDDIDVLEKHLAVCEACLKYSCPVSPKRLRQLQEEKDESAISRFFNEVIRSANKHGLITKKADKTLTDTEFKDLLDDILLIHDHLFQDSISSLEVKKLFIKCLLSFGREKFSLAIKFMKDLGVENCTQLILDSSRDYVNSANSLTDKKSMTLAKTCLNLLSNEAIEKHPEVREERDFIQALQVISDSFDFPFLPIQVRLMQQPRLEVIEKLLRHTPRGYKNIGQLLNIAELLRVCRDLDFESRQAQVLILIGESALLENDYSSCMTVCSKLMTMKKNRSGWRLCLKLGVNVLFDDSKNKHKLLSFALTYCDSEEEEHGKRLAFILKHIDQLERDITRQEERKRLQAEIPLKVIKGSADVIKGGAGVIKGSAQVISRESAQVISGSARVLTNELSKTAQDFTSWLLPTLKTIKNDLVDSKTFAYAPEPVVESPPTINGTANFTPLIKPSEKEDREACLALTPEPVEPENVVQKEDTTAEDGGWDDWGSEDEESSRKSSPVLKGNIDPLSLKSHLEDKDTAWSDDFMSHQESMSELETETNSAELVETNPFSENYILSETETQDKNSEGDDILPQIMTRQEEEEVTPSMEHERQVMTPFLSDEPNKFSEIDLFQKEAEEDPTEETTVQVEGSVDEVSVETSLPTDLRKNSISLDESWNDWTTDDSQVVPQMPDISCEPLPVSVSTAEELSQSEQPIFTEISLTAEANEPEQEEPNIVSQVVDDESVDCQEKTPSFFTNSRSHRNSMSIEVEGGWDDWTSTEQTQETKESSRPHVPDLPQEKNNETFDPIASEEVVSKHAPSKTETQVNPKKEIKKKSLKVNSKGPAIDPVQEMTKRLLSPSLDSSLLKPKGRKTPERKSSKPKVTPIVVDNLEEEWQDWDDSASTSKVSSSASSLKSVDVKSKNKKPIVVEEDPNEGWQDW